MVNKEEILRIVKEKGPVIPNEIKKLIGGDTFLISAVLSEMVQEKIIKISHTKIGSSPTYYTLGQEHKLQELKKYLNEKDRRTFDLLRQKVVVRDKEQNPLTRVGLRNIKDFAKPLEVSVSGEKEIFWKWYSTPKDEAEKRIRAFFTKAIPKKEEKKIKKEEALKKTGKKAELKKTDDTNTFINKLSDYFEEKNINVLEKKVVRKNVDVELVITIPTSVGRITYFCKAKNKKKCNDGDLSSAYINGQTKKLPVIFITTGDITKKAKEMLEKEFKGMVVKKI